MIPSTQGPLLALEGLRSTSAWVKIAQSFTQWRATILEVLPLDDLSLNDCCNNLHFLLSRCRFKVRFEEGPCAGKTEILGPSDVIPDKALV